MTNVPNNEKPGARLEKAIDKLRQTMEATYDAFDELYRFVQDLKRQQAQRVQVTKNKNDRNTQP